jgi:hypothetical protein
MAKAKISKFPSLEQIVYGLAASFFAVWIIIGLVLLFIVVQGVRSGALIPSGQVGAGQTAQVPVETELPGIGTVNIECTQNALSPESIQKLLESGDIEVLEEQERADFENCIIS